MEKKTRNLYIYGEMYTEDKLNFEYFGFTILHWGILVSSNTVLIFRMG